MRPHHDGKRTGGTPGWKDSADDTCDWYEKEDRRCLNAFMYAGSMGAAKHCCVCIVKASSTTPTPRPTYWTPKPSISRIPCISTPEWKDASGESCNWYDHAPNFCRYSNDGGMGPASENCCACMISSSPRIPSTTPTPSSSSSYTPYKLQQTL